MELMRDRHKNDNEELSPRSRLARAIIEVRRILAKDRLHVKKENARKELAHDIWKVRSILNEVGFEGPDFYRELSRSLKEHTSKYPNLYEKK